MTFTIKWKLHTDTSKKKLYNIYTVAESSIIFALCAIENGQEPTLYLCWQQCELLTIAQNAMFKHKLSSQRQADNFLHNHIHKMECYHKLNGKSHITYDS